MISLDARPWRLIGKIDEQLRLVTFMNDDLGFFDNETCRLERAPTPFGAKRLPMSPG